MLFPSVIIADGDDTLSNFNSLVSAGVWGVGSFGNVSIGEELPLWGLPQINRALAIIGDCPSGPCIIDGNDIALIFLVNNGMLTLYDLILQNAKPTEEYTGRVVGRVAWTNFREERCRHAVAHTLFF